MVFRGHLPYRNTGFEVLFYSVEKAGGGLVGGFRTDSLGRYCIVWAPEPGTFVIHGREAYGYFDENMGRLLSGPPPTDCQLGNRAIPWFRARDLASSTQYLSVLAVGLITLITLALAIGRERAPDDGRLTVVGLGLAAATTCLFLAVWLPVLISDQSL